MSKKKCLRIIHLPESVGGNAFCLSNAMRRIGIDSECWILKPNYLKYGFDKSIARPDDGYFLTEIKRILALRYIFQFDVVFFNFGSTLFRPIALRRRPEWSMVFYVSARAYMLYAAVMQRIELLFLWGLRKHIVIQYQGDDARQGDYCLAHYETSPATEVDEYYYHPASDDQKRRQIRFLQYHCKIIYALNPDLLNVLPPDAKFLPYSHIELKDWQPNYLDAESSRPLRVGHAPTHRGIKGTSHFLAALEKLCNAGLIFELVLIENLSQQEAKAVYSSLDIVLDQLFVGWYGGLAVEAMALGKPVAAYIRQDDLKHIPATMREQLPVYRLRVETLEADLKNLLSMSRQELAAIGKRSRDYVELWHNPEAIASNVIEDIRSKFS